MPAVSSTTDVSVLNTSWMVVGMVVYYESAGYFSVSAIGSATLVTLTNLGYAGNASPGSIIPSIKKITPGGIIGVSGSSGTSGSSGSSGTGGSSGSSGTGGTSGSGGSSGSSGSSGSAGSSGTSVSVSGTTNYVVKFSSSSTVATGSMFDNGNIGIGSSSPAAKLDIRQASAATGLKVFTNDTSTAYIAQFIGYDNSLGDTTRMIIQAGGSVGIGTTSPAGKLHIVQNNAIGRYSYFGSNSGLFIKANDNSINSLLILENTQPAANYGASINFNLGYGGDQGTAGTAVLGSRIVAAAEQTWTSTDSTQDAYLAFHTTLNGSSSEKVRITSVGNVGIGTTSPSSKLHVYDNGGSFRTDLDATYHMGILNEYVSTYVTRTKFGRWGTTSNLELYYDIAGTEEARITRNYSAAVLKFNRDVTTDMIIDGNGNVGIGTTAPATKFEMYGGNMALKMTGATTGSFQFKNSSGTKIQEIRYDDSDGSMTLGGIGSYPIKFITSTTEKVRIAGDGNVGIGTSSPAYKLDVAGSVYSSNYFSVLTAATYGPSDNSAVMQVFGSTGSGGLTNTIKFVTGGSERVRIDSSGNLLVGNSGGTGYRLNVKAPFSSVLGGAYIEAGEFNQKTLVINNTNPSVSSNLFEAQKSGSAVFVVNSSANLGIGTSNATNILTIYNSSTPAIDFNTGTSTSRGRISATSSDLTIAALTSSPLVFKIDTSEKARITSAGLVGIGTTSPAAILDVVNTGRIQGILRTQSTPRTTFYDNAFAVSTDGGGATGFIYTSGTGGTFPLDFYGELILQSSPRTGYNNGISLVTGTTSPSVKLRISEVGNVGIGTTSPNELLEVTGTSPIIRVLATSGNSTLRLTDNGVRNWDLKVVDTSDYFEVGGTNTTSLIVTGTGNVGIGDSAPSYKLDVSGSVRIYGSPSNGGLIFRGSSSTQGNIRPSVGNGTVLISDDSGGATRGMTVNNNGGITVSTANASQNIIEGQANGSQVMCLNYNGNIGLGTSSPAAKLHVVGDAILNGLKSIQLDRTVAAALNSYTNIGAFDIINGAHSFIVSINASLASYSVAKTYVIANQYNATAGSWKIALPISDSGPYSEDFQLLVNFDTRYCTLRIRKSYGSSYSGAYSVTILYTGYTSATFTPDTSTGTDSSTLGILDSNVFTQVDGVVGIGTTSPGNSKLHIYADHVTNHSILKIQTITAIASGGVPSLAFFDSDGSRNTLVYAASDGTYLANEVAKPIIFSTNGTERMRLDSTGGINIGTSSQLNSSRVSIADSALKTSAGNCLTFATATGGSNDFQLIISRGSNTSGYYAFQAVEQGVGYKNIVFNQNGGNVGIGTTSPTNGTLQVYNASGNTLSLQKSGGYAALMMGSENNNYALIESLVNGGIRFYTGDGTLTEKMRIISTGEVGIGTTAAFSTGGTAQLSVTTNVNAVALSFGASNTDMSYIRRLSAGVFQWQTYNGANDGQIHLQPYGGNVGIGTTSPTARLHIRGGTELLNTSGSTGSTTSGSLMIVGQNTKGGANYHDFLYTKNSKTTLNPNKHFRLDNIGNFEIINSAYTSAIFTLTDSGSLLLPTAQSRNVTQLRNTGAGLKVGNFGLLFDDGNVHLHSTSPGTNLWLNCSGSGMFVVNGQSGATNGMCVGTSIQKGFVTIVGSVSAAITQPYGYLISSGAGSTTGTSPNPYSLTCDNRVMSSEFNVPSDERLKDIKGEISLNKAIDLVTKITPIEFKWKDGVDSGLKAGYSAQQTYKAGFEHLLGVVNRPGLEATTDSDGFTNPKDAQFVMNYEQVTPYHSKLIKHLLDKVEKLEKEMELLKNRL
jgi:hypothetical protein